MARGGRRPGAGRPKGAPDRLTPQKKAFLRDWINASYDEAIQSWAQIQNPSDKFKCWLAAAEFAFPKLGRMELTGEGGGAVQVQIVKYQDEPPT
jgi:hypothetical protein